VEKKKLKLKKVTVYELGDDQLDRVAGGCSFQPPSPPPPPPPPPVTGADGTCVTFASCPTWGGACVPGEDGDWT
jgi:hypothetical protein